jgi:autotransporter-associated beta strand protein
MNMKTPETPTSLPAWPPVEFLQRIKTKLSALLALMCVALGLGSASGQTIFTWTNSAAGLDLGTAANWNPNGTPSIGSASVTGDTMLFDGQTSGALSLTSNGGGQVGSSVGNALAGIYVHLTANQVSPVTFQTTVANSASQGIRFNSFQIDAGAGSFILGKNSTTNCLDTLWGTSNPSQQGFTNNSVNPVIILRDVRWRYGAGGAHTIVFGGTGDYLITNDIANVNGAATLITKDGPGTMHWTGGNNSFWGTITTVSTPMTISGGTLVLHSSSLFPATTTINTSAGGLLVLDVPSGSQTIANPVTGGGSIQVNNGTLTLSGANTFTGNTTLNGGVLVANRAENFGANGPLGNGGLISFNGGTLQFSSVNTFDYSPRFTNAASQSFRFDTAGQNVTFTNALASTGGTLTKLGSGSLTLAGANTYNGATTVSAGKLVIQGAQGSGAITVANSAALGVNQGGQTITPASLTVGTSASATLEFNNVSSTSTAAIVTGPVSVGGTITINVNSGSFLIGQSYPLFTFSGAAPGVSLGTLVGAGGNLTTNGSTITLNITSLAYVWSGNANNNWDTSTANNWKVNGVSQLWANGGTALFDDTLTTANTNITLNAPINPASVTVNNITKPYSITSSGANLIGGSGSLTKNGNSTLTLAGGVNTYSGATTISGGTLSIGTLDNGGVATDIGASSSSAANLVLNGGTLQFTGGGATSDRLFTLGTAGGTIDDAGGGSVILNNAGSVALSGTGARTLTLRSVGVDELAAKLGDNGGATAITKSGAGTWVVTANNTNSGAVTITGGTLQVGNGGATGAVGSGNITINPAGSVLAFNRSGTLTNGVVSGVGSVTVDGGGTVVLPGNNSYSGGTTIGGGSTLQVGVGGATGQLAPNGNVTVDGTLDFNTSGTFAYGGTGFAGGGNVIVRGGGKITSLGANSYSGWTLIGPGSTFQPCQGNQGALASSAVTNNGTLLMIRQDNGVFIYSGPITGSGSVLVDANNFNAGDVTLTGDNNYTGGTFIGDNGLIVGDSGVGGWITGNVTFQNSTQVPNDNARTLTFVRSDEVIFAGNIVTNFASPQSNLGLLVQNGSGTLTLTGTNTYGSGTTINSGTVQVGNGGNRGTIGTGPVTDNGILVWNRSDAVSFGRVISGTGSLVKTGAGVLTLSATNTYTGTTTVSNGTLVLTGGSLGGSVDVEGGTFVPASLATGGQLNVGGNVTIDSGTVLFPLNKSLSITNIVSVGTITRNGGSVVVTNVGPALAVNDKFYLFNAPVSGFATVTGAGATWKNDLATDGSITALTVPVTVNTNAPVVQVSVSGSTLSLGWPTNLGWTLQTNSVGLAANSQWFPVAGSASVTNASITINPAKTNVFFRLVYP